QCIAPWIHPAYKFARLEAKNQGFQDIYSEGEDSGTSNRVITTLTQRMKMKKMKRLFSVLFKRTNYRVSCPNFFQKCPTIYWKEGTQVRAKHPLLTFKVLMPILWGQCKNFFRYNVSTLHCVITLQAVTNSVVAYFPL